MRTLFALALAGFIGYWLVRILASRFIHPHETLSNNRTKKALPLVACRQCGVHLPLHLAIKTEAGYFCDKEHEEIYARTK